MKYGIDVSYCQEGMDFQAAADDGKEFAIIRLGRRGDSGRLYLDTSFIDNINNALAAGMQVGLYFYTKATSVEHAAEDAAWVLEQLNTYCQNTTLALGVWYDVEDEATTGRLGNDEITAICSRFVSDMNAAGYPYVGIYSSYNWFTNKINTNELGDYVPYWAANYGSSRNWFAHENPDKHCPIWQCADNWTDSVNDAKGICYDGDIIFEYGEDPGAAVL